MELGIRRGRKAKIQKEKQEKEGDFKDYTVSWLLLLSRKTPEHPVSERTGLEQRP